MMNNGEDALDFEVEISELSQFIKYIDSLPIDFSICRGQECDWSLLPSVLREKDGYRIYGPKKAKTFIEDFKNDGARYIPDSHTINNKNEWLVYAQHFGMPTNLLDFTYSPLISLMFALENAFSFDDEGYAVVWFLNPIELNKKAINRLEIVNLFDEKEELFHNLEVPIVVNSPKNNSRIAAQNGLFVYFPQNKNSSLEMLEGSNEFLKKVKIPYSAGKNILVSLYRLGLRFNNIYPELSSISKDVLLKNNVQEYYYTEA